MDPTTDPTKQPTTNLSNDPGLTLDLTTNPTTNPTTFPSSDPTSNSTTGAPSIEPTNDLTEDPTLYSNGNNLTDSSVDNSLINVILVVSCIIPFVLIACYACIMYRRRPKMVVNINSKQNRNNKQISVNKSMGPGQIEGYVDDKAEFESDNSSENEDSKLQDVLVEVLKMVSNDVQQVSTYDERKENRLKYDVANKRMISNESLYDPQDNDKKKTIISCELNHKANLVHKIIMDTRQKTRWNEDV